MNVYLTLVLLLLSLPCRAQNCNGIQKKVDQLTGSVSYMGIAAGSMQQIGNPKAVPIIVMGKQISKSDTAYVLSLGVSAISQPAVGSKGISILFSDGSRIDRPDQEVKVQSTANAISINAEPLFSTSEFSQLSTKTLIGIRILTSEGTIHFKLANSVNVMATCLLTTW